MGKASQSGLKRRMIAGHPPLGINLAEGVKVGGLVALAADISGTPVWLDEAGILGRRVGG